ncbi:unnamed protein product [Cuscuta campestris]|nr:unnamed protein product [Cuscuta campestris]
MTDLKESLDDVKSIPLLLCPPVASGISSQSEFIPTDEASHRIIKERTPSTSEGTYEIQASKSYGVSQDSNPPQDMRLQREVEEVLSSFPPSFTSFLKSCGPAIDEQAQQTASQDLDLKAQITKYMEDSSFQDMLLKVEKVINEVGDFSILL